MTSTPHPAGDPWPGGCPVPAAAPEGAFNFRDLGGARTVDGRQVRRGLVYRCGALDGLPPLGVPRLDDALSLADLISPTASTPPPPTFGATNTQPTAPSPAPAPTPTPPPPVSASTPVGPVLLRNGTTLPPPNDQPVT